MRIRARLQVASRRGHGPGGDLGPASGASREWAVHGRAVGRACDGPSNYDACASSLETHAGQDTDGPGHWTGAPTPSGVRKPSQTYTRLVHLCTRPCSAHRYAMPPSAPWHSNVRAHGMLDDSAAHGSQLERRGVSEALHHGMVRARPGCRPWASKLTQCRDQGLVPKNGPWSNRFELRVQPRSLE